MTFTYPTFLLIFLPIVIILFYISKVSYRPQILLISSIFFYICTNIYFFVLLFLLILLNYVLGKKLYNFKEQQKMSRRYLMGGILVNAILLLAYKFLNAYGPELFLISISDTLKEISSNFALPLGISYITFQNISYLFDIHNQVSEPETNFINFALYTLFFPKVLVGPIMRYQDMKDDLRNPKTNPERIYTGARRVVLGLAKKVLIADTIGRAINPSFSLVSPKFSTGIAWFMLIGYAVQLYYDFSGLTDMAVGMGEIFGFRLVENFNFPFIAQSISDFWRRWHISLSSWIRNYIFTPLEFKRRHVKFARQQTNIIIAFFVMGIWHGLTPTYIVWGLFNGIILALEMTFLSKWLKKAWQPIRHVYTIFIFLISCIFLRSNSLNYSFGFLASLFGFGSKTAVIPYNLTNPLPIIDNTVWIALIIGILFSTPLISDIFTKLTTNSKKATMLPLTTVAYDLLIILLFVISLSAIVNTSTLGNIYAGF